MRLFGEHTDKSFVGHLRRVRCAPLPPLKPILTTEEPTYEGLVKLLLVGQPSMGLFSDEGGRFLGTLTPARQAEAFFREMGKANEQVVDPVVLRAYGFEMVGPPVALESPTIEHPFHPGVDFFHIHRLGV